MNFLKNFFAKKYKINFYFFVATLSFINLILYHKPLLKYSLDTIYLDSFSSFMILATVVFAQLMANILFFTLLGILWAKMLYFLSFVFCISNAIAVYFISSYGVILTEDMMGNVFNTNPQEAFELFSPIIFVYILFLGILPCLFLLKIKIKKASFLKKIGFFFLGFVLVLIWGFANSHTWLWVDKNSKNIGGLSLPMAYIINSATFKAKSLPKAKQKLLPPLSFKDNQKQLVVLVIGEAARANNFSLYGYTKNTNPLLKQEQISVMPNTRSYGTYTTIGISCILSHKEPSSFISYEPLTSYLKRFGADVLWRSNNWGEPKMNVSLFQRGSDIRKLCDKNCGKLEHDDVLFYKLKEQIRSFKSNKIFVVLHEWGSHGPNYNKRYPKYFEKFLPTCKSVELQKCSQEELVNAYDNTIFYNDFLLHKLIQDLKSFNFPVVMLYISDHGESLGEGGFYLHGAPNTIAPKYQREIPFIVWMNDEFKKQKGLTNKSIIKQNTYSQEFIFHSILGAFEANSSVYNPTKDIFK